MKVLTIQDVHVSPKWIEESKKHITRVCDVARKEKVSAILSAGDWFDCQVVASDENYWNEILAMARDMQAAAQVYYITGTPRHDSPGCYSSFNDIGWIEIGIGNSKKHNGLLIMGIPEITQSFIVASRPDISKEEAVSKQYEIFGNLIDSYYKPLSMEHDGPVHFMGHGHVSGVKFRDDQKPRTSDFMYSEEMLMEIGADYYQFGHIHLPQEFKKIKGGYGGSAHITWNDIGFIPGFDVITYGGEFPRVERFSYGELERQKIVIKEISDIQKMKPKDNVNLWIDIECDKSFAEQFDASGSIDDIRKKFNIGPLSKITTTVQHVDNVRVDSEVYEKAKSLTDIYKIYDPEASDSILRKVFEMDTDIKGESVSEHSESFQIEYLYLRGSIAGMENGVKEIEVDFNDFNTGSNLIVGPNGTGKSFILGFAPPFSEHLPKGDDLKGLFLLKDSQIVRRYSSSSGNKITQKILIDPTLASPAAKYFMDVNGVPLPLCTGNKGPFDDAVNEIFGSLRMFMMTAFRGQKENKDFPSLENAKESDLRQIFMEISGINRADHKQYAHDKAVSLKKEMELSSREKETVSAMIEDSDFLKSEMDKKESGIRSIEQESAAVLKQNVERKKSLSKLESDSAANNEKNKEILKLSDQIKKSESSIHAANNDIHKFRVKMGSANETRKELSDMEGRSLDVMKMSEELNNLQAEFNTELNKWNSSKDQIDEKLKNIADSADKKKESISGLQAKINEKNGLISMAEKEIELLNKPCEHCGMLSGAAGSKIEQLKSDIVGNEYDRSGYLEEIKQAESSLETLREEYKTVKSKLSEKPAAPDRIEFLKTRISKNRVSAEALEIKRAEVRELDGLSGKISAKESEIAAETARISDIKKDLELVRSGLVEIDYGMISTLKRDIESSEKKMNEISSRVGSLSAEIRALNSRIEKANELKEKVKSIESEMAAKQSDVSEWTRIEEAFSPKGIPALELSLEAPKITSEANRLLSIYGTRFNIEIITQEDRGKDMIEKFKILVHDSILNSVKNLPNISGGQGVWVSKAIQESAAKIHSERTGKKFLFSIMDEADAALDKDAIGDFYDMMNRAMDGERKLISVSHSTEAESVVQNVINVKKFFKGE